MSASLNKVIIIGHVGKKPEIAKTGDDKKTAKFSIATTEQWHDRDTNERREKTEWHRIIIYNTKLADVIESYVEEGMLVYVEGKIKYEKWVDPQGVEKKATSIVVDLSGKFLMLGRSKNSMSETAPVEAHDNDLPF